MAGLKNDLHYSVYLIIPDHLGSIFQTSVVRSHNRTVNGQIAVRNRSENIRRVFIYQQTVGTFTGTIIQTDDHATIIFDHTSHLLDHATGRTSGKQYPFCRSWYRAFSFFVSLFRLCYPFTDIIDLLINIKSKGSLLKGDHHFRSLHGWRYQFLQMIHI